MQGECGTSSPKPGVRVAIFPECWGQLSHEGQGQLSCCSLQQGTRPAIPGPVEGRLALCALFFFGGWGGGGGPFRGGMEMKW